MAQQEAPDWPIRSLQEQFIAKQNLERFRLDRKPEPMPEFSPLGKLIRKDEKKATGYRMGLFPHPQIFCKAQS